MRGDSGMKPSDKIHKRVDEMIKRESETGYIGLYRQGYPDKLLSAILEYLDEQASVSS